MSGNEALPPVLPVFPLTGVLLLPGTYLPLHVFEPRYRNMVRDVLANESLIGMIQPREAQRDDLPQPALCEVGCAGRIARWRQTPDGRYELVLQGISRFRVAAELPTTAAGYRLVTPRWGEFEADLVARPEVDISPLDELLGEIGIDGEGMEELQRLEPAARVDTLAAHLPFSPAEKQALLEAADAEVRLSTLISLILMGFSPGGEQGAAAIN